MTDPNKNEDLAQINKAFTKVDEYIPKWLEYERYYNAKHTKEQLNKLEKLGRSKLFITTTRNIVNIIANINIDIITGSILFSILSKAIFL